MFSFTWRSRALALLAGLATLSCRGAEPAVDPGEMPRIPPTEPEQALATFSVKPGFQLELAAGEPLVIDPVTLCFDERGRLFVIEMIDYSERRDERPHLGRVRMLEDIDGDGRFDRATVYADNLPWPTAIVCYDGGVFVGATPDIVWCRDRDGDGKADEQRTVFSGFGSKASRLNVQALFNSFQWGMDNRIHGSCGTIGGNEITRPDRPDLPPLNLGRADFSFDPKTLDLKPENGGGQYGMSFDSAGRKFLCSNSDHAQMAMYRQRDAGRNPLFPMPSHRVSIAEDGRAAEVFRLSPDEPWRIIRTRWRISGVVRGMVEGGGRVSGYFTGATGLTVFQGDAYGEGFLDNLFVGDAGGNLVHRKVVDHTTLPPVARRPADERDREFIASTDTWFRPVHFANGPDGCLYIADMYRETIEHPWSLPEPIKRHLDLNSGNNRGRIYRVVPEGFRRPSQPSFYSATPAQLLGQLDAANGWTRLTASRLLFQEAPDNTEALVDAVWDGFGERGRIHALSLLASLGELSPKRLIKALGDRFAGVRAHALAQVEAGARANDFGKVIADLAGDPSLEVRYQLALLLGRVDLDSETAIALRLLETDGENQWVRSAVLNATHAGMGTIFEALGDGSTELLGELARMAGASGLKPEVNRALSALDRRWDRPGTARLLAALDTGLRQKRSRLADHLEGSPVERRLKGIARWLNDAGGSDKVHPENVTMIAAAGYSFAAATLKGLLSARHPAPLRHAAVGALMAMPDAEAFASVLENWASLDAQEQRDTIRNAVNNRNRAQMLLAAAERGTVSKGSFGAADVEALRKSRDKAVSGLALKLFGKAVEVSFASLLERYRPALSMAGTASAGREIFAQRCATCHRAEGAGHALGPDLVTVKTKGRENLLLNIVNPNAEVAPQYMAFEVETDGEESYTALLGNETPTHVTLHMAGGIEKTLQRREVRGMRSNGRSLMPEGLQEGLSVAQMADLLRFIETAD